MKTLIQLNDINTLCRVCSTEEQSALNCIADVERFSIRTILGSEFFAKVLASPDDYSELLEGGTEFEYQGKTYLLDGLKKADAYLSYSLYYRDWETTDFSQPVTQTQIVSISDKFKAFGDDMLKICRYFCISKGYVKILSDDNENSRYISIHDTVSGYKYLLLIANARQPCYVRRCYHLYNFSW